MKKKTISKMIKEDIGWVLEGSLEGAIAYLKAIPSKFPDYSNFHIKTGWDEYRKTYNVYADRLETDKEFEKRVAGRIKELERLKKKYEKE